MQGLMMDFPLTISSILEYGTKIYNQKKIRTKQPDGSIHEYSFRDFYKRTKKLANVLKSLGIKDGDKVGTFSWNNYQHLECYYAIPCSGAVIHTVNIRLSADQLIYIINHSDDKLLFVDITLLPIIEKIADKLSNIEYFIVFNSNKAETKLSNVLYYEELLKDASDEYIWPDIDENQAMGLCYTSGTTGEPKGVLYSHRSMYLHTVAENQANYLGLVETDTLLPVVPMFHVMSWGLPYSFIMAGSNVIFPGPHLKPESLAEMIESEKVTVAAGVPTIWNGLFQDLKQKPRDTSSLRYAVVGGSAMPKSLIDSYQKELGINILHAWGMTETSPLGTVARLRSYHQPLSEDEKLNYRATQGFPINGIEIRIVDDNGQELDWDGKSMGELQVRGAWVVKAYYKVEPSPESFTDDGWFRTGDVATINSEGYMQITDRTKDLIKSGGEWISSVELENNLMAYNKVLEAAVIAIPDDKWSERPMALVVSKPDNTLTEEELQDHLSKSFPKFWIPEKFLFVDEIPKTTVGKFDKKVIRKKYSGS